MAFIGDRRAKKSAELTVSAFVRFRPILLFRANHSDTDNEAVHVQLGRFVVAVHRGHCDSSRPIRLNHFGCADNGLALDDPTDNTPMD